MLIENFKNCMGVIQDEIESNVEFINSGGCGLFAVELSKRMMSLGLEDTKIRVYDPAPSNDISELESSLRVNGDVTCIHTWNSNGILFSHVAVEWMEYVWDAECNLPISQKREWAGFKMYPGSISLETMEALTKSPEGWNSLYRRWQDKIVRSILDDAFRMFS